MEEEREEENDAQNRDGTKGQAPPSVSPNAAAADGTGDEQEGMSIHSSQLMKDSTERDPLTVDSESASDLRRNDTCRFVAARHHERRDPVRCTMCVVGQQWKKFLGRKTC
ncbi:hypothetical protein B0H11DRAFT_1898963 [Mycena galericulata]|nr:hypothetical protein B0H11DRAFT_1898963 [Mycena galericulata]